MADDAPDEEPALYDAVGRVALCALKTCYLKFTGDNNAGNFKHRPWDHRMVDWKVLFEPFKEIVDLRREAQECLIIHGNLSKDAPEAERRIASDAFRKVGAGLLSRYLAAYPWVNWWCAMIQWDIHSAGPLLISIGNTTQFKGFSFASLSPTAALIRTCLRLKEPATPGETLRALQAHAGEPCYITD